MKHLGIHLSVDDDQIIWYFDSATGQILAQLAYDFLVDDLLISVDGWWRKEL